MRSKKLFLLEHGSLIVIQNDESRVSFNSIDEFNEYCFDYQNTFTNKYYIDYEPENNIYIDSEDQTIDNTMIPNSYFDLLISNVDIFKNRKDNRYFNLSKEEAVALKCAEITDYRENLLVSGYSHTDNYDYDTDQKSRERLLGIIQSISLGNVVPEGFTWRTSDNQNALHTNASLINLFSSLLVWEQTLLMISWNKKDVDIKALYDDPSKTVEDIKNYDVTTGWD